jgi:chromosome segregation ATPase
MAPSKPKPPLTSTLPTSDTDPPESLLWAYQLRREHSYLLSRVDAVETSNKELVVEYKKIVTSNKELVVSNQELRASNEELSATLKTVTEQNRSFGDKIQEIETGFQGLSNKILRLDAAASCDPEKAICDLWEVVDKERSGCVRLNTSLDKLQADWKTDKEERVRDIEALRETIRDLRKIRELEAKVAATTVEGKKGIGAFDGESIGRALYLLLLHSSTHGITFC